MVVVRNLSVTITENSYSIDKTMTQKEIRHKLNDLFFMVEQLESGMGFLPLIVDPNQEEWVTNIEGQVVLIKVEINSLMRQLQL
jgi:hypothetical protein